MPYDPLDRETDCFRPPAISTLVGCIHCGNEFDSYQIEWRVVTDADGKQQGFWCCPIPGCDGKGFGFDIFPVDPDYRNENGERMWCSDDDAEEEEELPDDDEEGESPAGEEEEPPW